MTTPSAVLIVNPTAGRGAAGRAGPQLTELLRAQGMTDVVWRHTARRDHARELAQDAAQEGVPLVVAVGGDGTLHETVNGLHGTDSVLGLLPFGTGNDFARALGLHGNLEQAVRALSPEGGKTVRVDTGLLDGNGTQGPHRFLVLTGTGFDARTAQTVNAGIRGLSGPLAYVWGAIVTARAFRPFQITLTTDGGETIQTPAMFASFCNTETTGGGMKIAPGAQVDDGLLDICLVRALPNMQMLWQLTKVFKGEHVKHPAVTMLRAARVTVDADPPQPLLIDGEVLGTTPATITVEKQSLALRVPVEVASPPR